MNIKNLAEKEYFKTPSLSLAAFLSSQSYIIESLDRSDSQRIVFIIKRDEILDSLIQSFWRKECVAEPQTYFEHLKMLKSRIYEAG